MSAPLLKIDALSKRFGGFAALSEVSLNVPSGERLGIIGPNGSGKTTLINCIAGSLSCDGGGIIFDGVDVTPLPPHRRCRLGIARSFQLPRPFATMTVRENVAVPLQFVTYRSSPQTSEVAREAGEILDRAGLSDKADLPAGELTQIDLRKLELARAMAIRPRLLLLDEVMAGLSPVEVDQVLGILDGLKKQSVTVVMIEHIMRAIMRFSDRVLCLDAGRIVADAPPEDIVQDNDVQRIYLGLP
jgi:branched-chain amino acid transport system ATP-binding protein